MKIRFIFITAIFFISSMAALAQQVRYSLAFPNAVHHEAEIAAVFEQVKQPVLEVRMSRSSPGRYALHEFAKNVYNVQAFGSKGQRLEISRPNPHQWNISGHDGSVKVTYTLFADRADGTYSAIDLTHAHLNMPATLLYAPGFEQAPHTVSFQIPEGTNWKIATQLKQEPQPHTFSAPNLQYLMDSPAELSDFMLREWTVEDKGKTATFQIAMHHTGTEQQLDAFTEKTKRLVQQAKAVFGELPAFDFGRYTFIACYVPHAAGDGMEHRNSTILTSPNPLITHTNENLSTASHELVHAWNVERLRPQSLEPFNFADANMSGELWFAEGFTSYYGELLLKRSGVYTTADYARSLTGELNYVLFSPGHLFFSPVEISYQAPFVDAARSVDPVNRHNTFTSYYYYGSMLGLALDLTLRSHFRDISLDDYMRLLWQQFGKPEKPYTMQDLQQALAQLTQDERFAQDFFQRHIYGKELPVYEPLFEKAGFKLRKANPGKATLGPERLSFSETGIQISNGTTIGSPLYNAGLDREDFILKINGKSLKDQKALDEFLKKQKPGKTLELEYRQRGQVKNTRLTLAEAPQLELVPLEAGGGKLTEAQETFRKQWLDGKSK